MQDQSKSELLERKHRTRALEASRQNKKLRQENEKISRELQNLKKVCNELQTERDENRRKDREREDFIRKLKSKVTGFRGMPLKKVMKLKEKCTEQDHHIRNLELQLQSYQDKIGVLNDALELNARQQGREADVLYDYSKYKRENMMLRQDLHEKQNHLNGLSKQLEDLNQEFTGLSEKYEEVVSKLEKVKDDKRELKDDNVDLYAENDSLKQDNETLLLTLEEKQNSLNELNDMLDKLSSDHQMLKENSESRIEELSTELSQRIAELNNVQTNYDELVNATEMDGQKVQELFAKNDSLSKKVSELQKKLTNAESQLVEKQIQLDELTKMNAELDESYHQENEQREAAEKALKEAKQRVEELNQEVQELTTSRQNAISMQKAKLEEMIQQRNETLEDRDEWRRKYDESISQIQSISQEREDALKREKEAIGRFEQMKKSKSMLQETLMGQIRALRREHDERADEYFRIQRDKSELEKEVSRLSILHEAKEKSESKLMNSSTMSTMSNHQNLIAQSRHILEKERQRMSDCSLNISPLKASNSTPLGGKLSTNILLQSSPRQLNQYTYQDERGRSLNLSEFQKRNLFHIDQN